MAPHRGSAGGYRKVDLSTPMGANGAECVHLCPMVDRCRKRCSQRRASHHRELWEDVYASWMRYKFKFPIEEGKPHQEDVARMKALWGHPLELQ